MNTTDQKCAHKNCSVPRLLIASTAVQLARVERAPGVRAAADIRVAPVPRMLLPDYTGHRYALAVVSNKRVDFLT